MASHDFLNREDFGLLPQPSNRIASFGLSTIVNLIIASILLLLTINKIHQAETNHYYSTQLSADGHIQILGVVNGLGHGLDEEAAQAVEQIRYKPAMQSVQPVDQVSLIHVTFQLA